MFDDGCLSPLELLLGAIQFFPLSSVEEIVRSDPRLLLKEDEKGWLPLHYAARFALVDVVQYLAEKCSYALFVKDEKGWLPLHIAAQKASVEVVQCLSDKCPDALLIQENNGWLPLHLAAQGEASLKVVKCLADRCPEALLVQNKIGCHPLHIAARFASVEVVQYLACKCPLSLLIQNIDGWLPLHVAAGFGKSVKVQCLADKCPDALLVEDKRGCLPVDVAREYNQKHPDVAVWLEVATRDWVAEQESNRRGRPAAERAADERTKKTTSRSVGRREETGFQRLLRAIQQRESLRVIKSMVESNHRLLREMDEDGWLPLHFAARFRKSAEVVRYLADKRPEALLVKCNRGWLPMHVAARFASVEVVQYLAGKCPRALLVQNSDGWLPLHVSAQHASVKVVQCLADACPEALLVKLECGAVPLHVAAQESSVEVVQCLADACPEALLVQSKDGWMPVDQAREYNKKHPDVVVWLEVATRDRMPKTAAAPILDSHAQNQKDRSDEPKAAPASVSDLRELHNVLTHPAMEPPSNEPTAMLAPDPDSFKQDRTRIRQTMDDPRHEPALVSGEYVESIRTAAFLGDGYFGTVYKGTDDVLAQEFAIKSIHPNILGGGTKEDIKKAMGTFRREQEVREYPH
jgi:ankyrin repeat protein